MVSSYLIGLIIGLLFGLAFPLQLYFADKVRKRKEGALEKLGTIIDSLGCNVKVDDLVKNRIYDILYVYMFSEWYFAWTWKSAIITGLLFVSSLYAFMFEVSGLTVFTIPWSWLIGVFLSATSWVLIIFVWQLTRVLRIRL
jgi:hypothetical protein